MAQLTISLPDELEQQLREAVRRNEYQTVSSLVSEALREKLNAKQPLRYWDRVKLVLQLENHRLLSTLAQGQDPISDENWNFSRAYDVLGNGYSSDYKDAFRYILDDTVDASTANFVVDVLDMYLDLQWSCGENKDQTTKKKAVFPGFDGNHELSLMTYTRHLVKNRRFAQVESETDDYNSHSMSPDYRSMLRRYQSVRVNKSRSKPLSQNEVLKILG